MFSATERADIRAQLVAHAEADPHIVGAALVGSAARGTQDEWSDIDLVFQLAVGADETSVVDEWTRLVDQTAAVADTLDVVAAGVRYRVFFLRSSLQIDLSFWPHDQFRATESAFEVLFGVPTVPLEQSRPDVASVIGQGWLYAIHARSAVSRGKLWQASMMLDELRESVITLKCLHRGLNPWHGREADRLPPDDLAKLSASRATEISAKALDESRILLARQFLSEVEFHDPDRFERLQEPFTELFRSIV